MIFKILTNKQFLTLPEGTIIIIPLNRDNPFFIHESEEESSSEYLDPFSIGEQLFKFCEGEKPVRKSKIELCYQMIKITLL